ncbi:GNAT family N-acetyltransferase [Saccharopolyspora hordei]|uniref:GNAT superfamily N-acetyltransferase n=1 Tax=Saccharopolyspora hordei TaxID=1838 RepID=A0A853APF5_9PSEU|nr:GNAT family N-acetyltransferase [Saccharopolyspora hordei]NYI82320.1 GNAT superfamily N-acetyltransferase [Saccharopolyspora hordei]
MPILSSPEPLSGDLLVRPAGPGEEEAVLDLLSEAAAWLRDRGIAQWPPRFPVESVQAQIAAGEALLVEREGAPVATVAVAEDDEFWGPGAEPAYYVSRLAVARRASGARLGHRIIDWVEAKAAARGWRYVRLATSRDNPDLRRYYEEVGFRHVADPPHARWPTSLYEREVGARHRVGPDSAV